MEILNKAIHRSIIAVLVFQLMGCGTLLYPERKGQKEGHLDAGVVILDAIGLLFFLIPGIIAFAVDFGNGTIYVPSSAVIIKGAHNMKEIKFDPKHTTLAQIEQIIKDETGKTVKLTQDNVRVSRLHSKKEMVEQFASVGVQGQEERIALAK